MAPAAAAKASSSSAQKSENSKSVKAVEELLSKLNISKAQDEVSQASLDLATLINGDIEDADAPTQYVFSNITAPRGLPICPGRTNANFTTLKI